nr:DUF4913 domain-containing protein [Micromonospora tarapacensis]
MAERRREQPAAVTVHPPAPSPPPPRFIYYLDGEEYDEALAHLCIWVEHVLLPTYGREVTSSTPWCPSWWNHAEAVAHLHALWMTWQELTGHPGGPLGPANWHRDYLGPVMTTLRDPAGPFAGCKTGAHRAKASPVVEPFTVDS